MAVESSFAQALDGSRTKLFILALNGMENELWLIALESSSAQALDGRRIELLSRAGLPTKRQLSRQQTLHLSLDLAIPLHAASPAERNRSDAGTDARTAAKKRSNPRKIPPTLGAPSGGRAGW